MTGERVIIFGEVLFDTFPDGSRTLGGAPFNVAWHLRALGLRPVMISRVGNDPAGLAVRTAMTQWDMDISGLQTDQELPTGRVEVHFDAGEPQYTILHPAAFDAIETQRTVLSDGNASSLLYHGSLALRSLTSRESLESLRNQVSGNTFIDVNLRPPWWRREDILEWVAAADWVKLNQHELQQLSETSGTSEDQAAWFLSQYELAGLILTRGEQGAMVLTAEQTCHQIKPSGDIELVDTVGAGDAFTSVMILGLVKRWAMDLTLHRAQEFASRICGQRGALFRNAELYKPFAERWNLNFKKG